MRMLNIGDIILYQYKDEITEWEINKFSPSGKYIAIENDDYDEHWVQVGDILEVIESEHGRIPHADEIDMDAVAEAAQQPIPRARTTKDYIRYED